jgi:hypothetical protein
MAYIRTLTHALMLSGLCLQTSGGGSGSGGALFVDVPTTGSPSKATTATFSVPVSFSGCSVSCALALLSQHRAVAC